LTLCLEESALAEELKGTIAADFRQVAERKVEHGIRLEKKGV